MRHYVGLDVSLDTTSLCIIDADGVVTAEATTPTEPDEIIRYLRGLEISITRIGVEAGAIAEWLVGELVRAGLPVICIEARHAHGMLRTNLNKTDSNDARGIAAIMRMGVYRAVHVKSIECQYLRTLITMRRMLQIKSIDLENTIGGLLRGFGCKVRRCKAKAFEPQVKALIESDAALTALVEPLLVARGAPRTVRPARSASHRVR